MITACLFRGATPSFQLSPPNRNHASRVMIPAALLVAALMPPPTADAILQAQDAPPAYALRNIVLHHHDGTIDSSATVVWRDGVIESFGRSAAVPFDAFVIDGGDSLHVYPGFIDGLNTWGSPGSTSQAPATPGRPGGANPAAGARTADPGNPTYERAGIQPTRSTQDLLKEDRSYLEALKAGFTAGNLVPEGRMLPGTSDLVLNSGSLTPASVLSEATGLVFRLEPSVGGWTSRAYPSTDMAVMARFKQLLYDARALKEHMALSASPAGARAPLPMRDPVLEALFPVLDGTLPVLFEAESPEDLQRYFMLKDEFGFRSIIYASGHLSGMEGEIKRRGLSVLTSFKLPEKPAWMAASDKAEAPGAAVKADDAAGTAIKADDAPGTEGEADADSSASDEPDWKREERDAFRSRQAKAWRHHAEQIRRYLDEGIPVGYAGMGTKIQDVAKGMTILLKDGGLDEKDLLRILTTSTAGILGADERIGAIRSGAIANLSVYDKPFSQQGASVKISVVNGTLQRH